MSQMFPKQKYYLFNDAPSNAGYVTLNSGKMCACWTESRCPSKFHSI